MIFDFSRPGPSSPIIIHKLMQIIHIQIIANVTLSFAAKIKLV